MKYQKLSVLSIFLVPLGVAVWHMRAHSRVAENTVAPRTNRVIRTDRQFVADIDKTFSIDLLVRASGSSGTRDPGSALKKIIAECGGSNGEFEDIASKYIEAMLRDGSGIDSEIMFNAIANAVLPASTRSYLFSCFFSNLKQQDFPKFNKFLTEAATNPLDRDQYFTAIRNNIHAVALDFEEYYAFVKHVDAITGIRAQTDDLLAEKFNAHMKTLPEDIRLMTAERLLRGSDDDRAIVIEYLSSQNFAVAFSMIEKLKVSSELKEGMIENVYCRHEEMSPRSALELVGLLNPKSGKRRELEAAIVGRWMQSDPVSASDWVTRVRDPNRRRKLSLIVGEYWKSSGENSNSGGNQGIIK